MAERIPDDIYENIFLRLDARNLISCKSVCKSWKSLISDSHFIKTHLNRSYNSNENGHKRIGEAVFLNPSPWYSMIGSSNGLVCIIYDREILVANPLTREVKRVRKPFKVVPEFDFDVLCGFGYDSLRDDYKVVRGFQKYYHGRTWFHVFSLKSNAWHVIGEVNYTRAAGYSGVGVLCNGAMHWVMRPENQYTKIVILSFDLSKEEFKEIPLSDYARHNPPACIRLGIMEECLCILHFHKLWVMKKYNEELSWEVVDNCQIKYEYPFYYTLYLKVRKNNFSGDMSFSSNILESLVSPRSYCYKVRKNTFSSKMMVKKMKRIIHDVLCF